MATDADMSLRSQLPCPAPACPEGPKQEQSVPVGQPRWGEPPQGVVSPLPTSPVSPGMRASGLGRDNSIPRSVSFSRCRGTSRIFPTLQCPETLRMWVSSPSLHSPWVTSGGGRGQAALCWPRCRHKKPLLAGFNPVIFRPPSAPEPRMTDFTLGGTLQGSVQPPH